MTKESLIKLKKELLKLSEEECIERDMYLKRLQDGTLQGPLVGIPSIDKSWVKHFSDEAIKFKLDDISMYKYMEIKAKKYKDAIAIEYFGRKISYSQILDKIEETAKAFKSIGVKKGDIVTVLLPSSPEAVYTVYALNKIGAIVSPIDPRTKEVNLKKYIEETNPKMIVTLDLCAPLINKVTNSFKVVSVSAIESLPYGIKKITEFINLLKGNKSSTKSNDCFVLWKDFIKQGKNYPFETEKATLKDDFAAIIYTGGTTGNKKGVKLSNGNINAMVEQHRISGIQFSQGQKFLDFLPPFIVYGLVMAIHMPLSLGFQIKMVPIFEPKDFPKLILKSKSEYVFASPVHYETLLKYNGKKNYSFLKVPVSGGDSMSIEFEQKVNEELKKYNCPSKLGQGLGMSEAGGTMSVPFPQKIKTGSVGLPFPNTSIAIYDPKTNEEMGYRQMGELCFKGPSLMMEYFNNTEETKKVLVEHEDGAIWLHTGDICYIDEDGYLYHVDRIKRIINRGGLKVYPSEIEKLIKTNSNINSCVVVSVDNEKERHVPVAHVVLKDKTKSEETEKEIIELCNRTLEPESIPYGIILHDALPYTLNAKIDFKLLESLGYDGMVSSESINEKIKRIK